jgi:hypothetical protein
MIRFFIYNEYKLSVVVNSNRYFKNEIYGKNEN